MEKMTGERTFNQLELVPVIAVRNAKIDSDTRCRGERTARGIRSPFRIVVHVLVNRSGG